MPILTPGAGLDAGAQSGPGVPGAALHDGCVILGDVTIGITDTFGVEWILTDLTGWSDPPGTTGSTDQRSEDHGGWESSSFYTPRTIGIEGWLQADTWAGASFALDRLAASIPAFVDAPLIVVESADRIMQAQVRQDGDPLVTRVGGWAQFSLSLTAPDPRRYDIALVTVSTGFPQTTGGLSLGGVGLSLPLSVGATASSGTVTAVNAGNMPTRPVLSVQGPCPGFAVTHRGSGRTLRFPTPVPAGHTLLIDTDRRTVLLDGVSPQVVIGTWFEYDPGINVVAFTASTYDPDALLTSTHRSAWR